MVLSIVVLSIFLRQNGASESKAAGDAIPRRVNEIYCGRLSARLHAKKGPPKGITIQV